MTVPREAAKRVIRVKSARPIVEEVITPEPIISEASPSSPESPASSEPKSPLWKDNYKEPKKKPFKRPKPRTRNSTAQAVIKPLLGAKEKKKSMKARKRSIAAPVLEVVLEDPPTPEKVKPGKREADIMAAEDDFGKY